MCLASGPPILQTFKWLQHSHNSMTTACTATHTFASQTVWYEKFSNGTTVRLPERGTRITVRATDRRSRQYYYTLEDSNNATVYTSDLSNTVYITCE